jgi:Protein of unknown function (DUF2891)
MTHKLTSDLTTRFAEVALGHVTREWPNKLDHVLASPGDVKSPRELHPVFYGSFDWHSCVHSHWLLARVYRRYSQGPQAANIHALLDDQFTKEKIAGELSYLARPSSRGFERPYGWAWLLMLQGELLCHTSDEGKNWAATLQPLADAFVQRFRDYLPLATYPVRSGVHSSTSFALVLALNYAKEAEDRQFADILMNKAREWHLEDENAHPFEPSQSDFLSPTLMEASLMNRVLKPIEYRAWLKRFLPRMPDALFTPVIVTDRSDGQIAHLDGLNLSRAWCWKLIVEGLPANDPLVARANAAIDTLLASALGHIADDYMGEHWLASFALLAFDPYR